MAAMDQQLSSRHLVAITIHHFHIRQRKNICSLRSRQTIRRLTVDLPQHTFHWAFHVCYIASHFCVLKKCRIFSRQLILKGGTLVTDSIRLSKLQCRPQVARIS